MTAAIASRVKLALLTPRRTFPSLTVEAKRAMEQIMVCGFGACYVCMRTFEVDGQRVLRRVCRDGGFAVIANGPNLAANAT